VLFGWGDLPEVTGVFDWELSTLGDPLADLAYTLVFWPDADGPSGGVPDAHVVEERFAPRFLVHPDYPTRRQFVERYERRTGLEFVNRRFYLALAAFKWAVVGEMFYARYLRGGAEEPMYRSMGEHVPAKAGRALAIVEGEWTI
jgi:aminoglycoside phosphotransferase (APT) family kinase protein